MPSDETYKFRFGASRHAADVSIEKAGQQQRTLEGGRARKRLARRARKHKQRRAADSVRREACPDPRLPSRFGALRTMMPRRDVAEAPCVEGLQYPALFVERASSIVLIEF